MHFENGHLYHIFNRGNNSQKIFYTRENYLFFLKKMRTYVLPYCDIVAWCLMPNHFHLLVYVNNTELPQPETESLTLSEALSNQKLRTLNDSIGIMLRTYARALQKQKNISGSVFQEHSKSICLTKTEGLSPAWFYSQYGTMISISNEEKDYPFICFQYIHQNPVSAGLCLSGEDWEFSSAPDYFAGRKGSLVNQKKAAEFGFIN